MFKCIAIQVYWKLEPRHFLSIRVVSVHYSYPPKVQINDKNGEATLVCSLLLQYRRNQRPINFSIVNEN